MVKDIEKKFSEEEIKALMLLKQQLSAIRNKGKFMEVYVSVRKGTNDIRKSDATDTDKKKALYKLCEETMKEISSSIGKK